MGAPYLKKDLADKTRHGLAAGWRRASPAAACASATMS